MVRHISLKKKIENLYSQVIPLLEREEDRTALQYAKNALSARGYSHIKRLDKIKEMDLSSLSDSGRKYLSDLLEVQYLHLEANALSTRNRNKNAKLSRKFTDSRKIRGLARAGIINYHLRKSLDEVCEEIIYKIVQTPSQPRYQLPFISPINRDTSKYQTDNTEFIRLSFGLDEYCDEKERRERRKKRQIKSRQNLPGTFKTLRRAAAILVPLLLSSSFSSLDTKEYTLLDAQNTKASINVPL